MRRRQVRFGARRVHHGVFGLITAAVGLAQGSPWLVAAGAALIAHDFADRRAWLPDLLAHPAWRSR